MRTSVAICIPLLLGTVACARPAPSTVLSPLEQATDRTEWSLKLVLESGTSGLDLLSADERARVLAQASAEQAPTSLVNGSRSERARKSSHAVVKALRSGDVKFLDGVSERDLVQAMKKVGRYSAVAASVKKVTGASECAYPVLSFALAAKAEEEFPTKQPISDAISLYSRAARCSSGETRIKSSYRLSLLHISQKDCAAALPLLGALVNSAGAKEYHSRSLFWKGRCHREAGELALEAEARDRLLAEFPLSYHAILLYGGLPQSLRSWTDRDDSKVLLRSKTVPQLNAAIQRIEALIALDQKRKVAKEWAALLPLLAEAEPEVRLYFSVLLHRSGNYPAKFRVLSPLFRERPELVSRAGLKLLYPHRDFTAEYSAGADSLLLLSLIRQESAFDPKARSSAGALGLMQVMPMTGRRVAGAKPHELLEPEKNLKVGSRYFVGLVKRFEGDVELALAAYNAGPAAVERWTRRYPVQDRVLFLDLIPYKETREYVASIARNYVWYRTLYGQDAPTEIAFESLRDRR